MEGFGLEGEFGAETSNYFKRNGLEIHLKMLTNNESSRSETPSKITLQLYKNKFNEFVIMYLKFPAW